jgi:hypothetical protein
VPVAGGWAVLEVVMSVPVDLAACVHPRFVRTASGHRLPDRPLSASAQRGCESDSQPGYRGREKAADGGARVTAAGPLPQWPPRRESWETKSVWVGFLQGFAGEAGGDDAGGFAAGGEVVVGAGQAVGDDFLRGLGLGDLLVEVGELAVGEAAPALAGWCA